MEPMTAGAPFIRGFVPVSGRSVAGPVQMIQAARDRRSLAAFAAEVPGCLTEPPWRVIRGDALVATACIARARPAGSPAR